jgi:hypothetical protein
MERSLAEVVKALAGGTMSRRQALAWMGATFAGAVLGRVPGASAAPKPDAPSVGTPAQHGAPLRGIDIATKDRNLEGRFGLMFKKLPAYQPPDELLTGTDVLPGLAGSMVEPQNASSTETDELSPAGFTFLGQFIDHDMTFDTTPMPLQQLDPNAITNFRTAHFDLDAVYGGGPAARPEFYNPDDPDKLRIGELSDLNQRERGDVPRDSNGKAFIGDPRNDENLILSQMHLAFLRFHNALVDYVRTPVGPKASVFEEARRLCRWHYQWMVVHDFLPKMVGQDTVNKILEERSNGLAKVKLSYFKPKNPNKPMMPIEYAAAAYRFGHSMVRFRYKINDLHGATMFEEEPALDNLNGFRPIPPELVIDWRHFFEIPKVESPPTNRPPTKPNRARPIDTNLSPPLLNLPSSVVPPPDVMRSLAARNLIRGKRLGLPSGQQVAKEMGVQALYNEELGLGNEPGWGGQAPLWFYILKEAELQHKGYQLGTVGGRIVAEVILGLLERDKSSYLHPSNKGFRPQPPIAPQAGVFSMGDLLKFAGVVD